MPFVSPIGTGIALVIDPGATPVDILKKLENVINRNFSEPFLEKGMVKAEIREWKGKPYLKIKILERDIDLDGDLNVIGAGTSV